jgi:prepilin-type N-terminal cleavage/methylation domain-containing protein
MRSLPRTGFTLIELMISITILSIVMMVVAMSLDSATQLTDRVSRQVDINNRANDVLNKLAMQLRMASAGNTATTSLELPGAYPTGLYTPQNPALASNVKAYYFAVSTGLGGAPTWTEQYEPYKRILVYDYSVYPGYLTLITRNSTGATENSLLLTPEVEENGFNLTRVGNTLQMNITLRSMTRTQESIIYTAQAQTIFLRSTLNQSSGSSAVTYVDDPDHGNRILSITTDAAPTILFGNLVTEMTTSPPQQQVSLFFTAPIGQKVDPQTMQVFIGNSDNSVSSVVAEGALVTVGTATVTRTTYPPAAQWPSRNGTYSVTLTGNIPSTVTIQATATTTAGIATNPTIIPTKLYR